jgi:uncharacterized membrane protein YeaQ/YmgE (transglycosylase-associated protein family)
MTDGIVWLLVGAFVPLVRFSMITSVNKPNLFVLLALGVGGAILGGPMADMFRPEADLFGVTGMVGAAFGAIIFVAGHRLVSVALAAVPTRRHDQFATASQETNGPRARTI